MAKVSLDQCTTTTATITFSIFLSPTLLSPSLSFRKVGNFVCSLSFVSRQRRVSCRVRMCAVVTFSYWQTIWLLRAIVVWIVVIGGRWLLVISYDVMRADDVSAEDLQRLQERLFQLGHQFKHLLNKFLQFWWVPALAGRRARSLRCFHKELSTQRKIYRTLSVVGNLSGGKNVWLLVGMEAVYHGMWWLFNIDKAKHDYKMLRMCVWEKLCYNFIYFASIMLLF